MDNPVTVTYSDGSTDEFHHVIRVREQDWWHGWRHISTDDTGRVHGEYHAISPDDVRSLAAPKVASEAEREPHCLKYYGGEEPPSAGETWRTDFVHDK